MSGIPGLPPEQLAMWQAMMARQVAPVVPPASGAAAFPGSAIAAASGSGGIMRGAVLGGGLPGFQSPTQPVAAAGWLQGSPAGQQQQQAAKRSTGAAKTTAAAGTSADGPVQKRQKQEGAAPAVSSPARTPAALASGPAINATAKKDEDTLLVARGLVPTAGPWVSVPSDALQHLQQHIYCSLAGSNAEQQQWGLNVVNLLTGTARSDFMQEGWEQVVGALLQLVNAGLDVAESLLVPAATGQQLLQELMPPPLWPSELTQPEEAGQQVPPHVLNALGIVPQQPGFWDASVLAPSTSCTHAVTCAAAAAHALANLSYLLSRNAADSSSQVGSASRRGDVWAAGRRPGAGDSQSTGGSSSDELCGLGSEEVGALLVRCCRAVEEGQHHQCPAVAECCLDLLRVAANAAAQLAAALATSPAVQPSAGPDAVAAPAGAGGPAAAQHAEVKVEPSEEEAPPSSTPASSTTAAAAGVSRLQVLMQHLAALAGGQPGLLCPLQLQTAATTALASLVCTTEGRAALRPAGADASEQQPAQLLPLLLAGVEACMTTDAEDAAAAVADELEGCLNFKDLAVDPGQQLEQRQLALLHLWRQAAAVAAGAHLLHQLLFASDACLGVVVSQRPWLVRTVAAAAVEEWPAAGSCGQPAEAAAAAIARRPHAHPAVAALGTAHPSTVHIQEQLLAVVHWSQAVLKQLAVSAAGRQLVVGQCDRLLGYVTEVRCGAAAGKTAPVLQLLLQLEQV